MKQLLERLRAFVGNLAPRERMLVGGAVGLAAVLFAWLLVARRFLFVCAVARLLLRTVLRVGRAVFAARLLFTLGFVAVT